MHSLIWKLLTFFHLFLASNLPPDSSLTQWVPLGPTAQQPHCISAVLVSISSWQRSHPIHSQDPGMAAPWDDPWLFRGAKKSKEPFSNAPKTYPKTHQYLGSSMVGTTPRGRTTEMQQAIVSTVQTANLVTDHQTFMLPK